MPIFVFRRWKERSGAFFPGVYLCTCISFLVKRTEQLQLSNNIYLVNDYEVCLSLNIFVKQFLLLFTFAFYIYFVYSFAPNGFVCVAH